MYYYQPVKLQDSFISSTSRIYQSNMFVAFGDAHKEKRIEIPILFGIGHACTYMSKMWSKPVEGPLDYLMSSLMFFNFGPFLRGQPY